MPKDRLPFDRNHSFRRVYFLGAGFSAGMNYPVGNALLTDLVSYLNGHCPPTQKKRPGFQNSLAVRHRMNAAERILKQIKEFLEEYFAVPIEKISAIKQQEFFSVAHALATTPRLFESDEDPDEPKPSTLQDQRIDLYSRLACVFRTYFLDICKANEKLPEDITSLLKGIRPTEDAVVCFNWDEEVDCFMSNQNKEDDVAYTLRSWKPGRRFLLLKPHGSVGWYDVAQGLGNKKLYFIADRVDSRIPRNQKRLVSFTENKLPLDVHEENRERTLRMPPVIMPPTFAKSFQYPEQQCIWRDILDVCSGAEEFVFLGYSLENDDFLTRAAIRSAVWKNPNEWRSFRWLIVDLTPNVMGNYRNLLEEPLCENRNFLKWSFGTNDSSFTKELENRLQKATL
jgi:hypothetical protein